MHTTLLRPEALRKIEEDKEREQTRQAEEQRRVHDEQIKQLHDAFMHRHLEPDAEAHFNRQVSEAATRGEHEILLLRFPSDWCSDGGRAINNTLEEWPDTLTGFAKELYDAYIERLRPLGYKLRAMVLDFPGGMPGDIGLFLGW